MSHPWFRLWADMVNDPKWRTIARTSGQSVSEVIAVALHMMTSASNAEVRGLIDGFEDEDVATALDMDTAGVTAIRAAMQGRFLQGAQLLGWAKRQPIREDSNSTGRVQAYRERLEAQRNAMKRDETQGNATKRTETLDKKRRDKDKNLNPLTPPVGGVVPGEARDDRTIDMFPPGEDDQVPPLPAKKPCPHQDIIALYHEVLPMCPQVHRWTEVRQALLRARWNEDPEHQSLEFWRSFFEFVATSKFLTGRASGKGDKPFVADLEWIVRPSNFIKIWEGKYADQ